MNRPKTHRWLLYYMLWVASKVVYDVLAILMWARVRELWAIAGEGLIVVFSLHAISLAMEVGILYGLNCRKKWGWQLNFFFLALMPFNFGLFCYESSILDGRYIAPEDLLPFALIFGLILILPNWIYFKKRKYLFDDGKGLHKLLFHGIRVLDSQDSKVVMPAVVSGKNGASSVSKEEAEADMNENEFYEKVAEEIDADNLVRGVWTRAFAEADGDENRAKAIYIKLRVATLFSGKKKQKNEGARVERERRRGEKKNKQRSAINRFVFGFLTMILSLLAGFFGLAAIGGFVGGDSESLIAGSGVGLIAILLGIGAWRCNKKIPQKVKKNHFERY